MDIGIGSRCVVLAHNSRNRGAIVVIVGDAGIRNVNGYGKTQCWFVDREIETTSGSYRNWTTGEQLRPLPPLLPRVKRTKKKVVLTPNP